MNMRNQKGSEQTTVEDGLMSHSELRSISDAGFGIFTSGEPSLQALVNGKYEPHPQIKMAHT